MIDINKLSASVPQPESEYIGQDGFAHCGKCHEPLELKIDVPLVGEKVVRCICSCTVKENHLQNLQNNIERIERNRRICFEGAKEKECRFDASEDSEIIRIAKNYADNFDEMRARSKGLLLYGTTGTGKSHAAACIANELIDKGVRCYMSKFETIINRMNETFDGRQKYLDGLNRYSLLILDDLGAERQSDYMQAQVFNVIDARYKSGLPFIITTNLSAEELKKPAKVSDSRIYDRVLEICHPIAVNGTSYRRQKLKDDFQQIEMILKG